MTSNQKNKRRVAPVGYLFAAVSFVAVFYYGQPWIQLHQKNLIIHDCCLHSETIPIGSKYPGRIMELAVQIGQRVDEGDVIARMDAKELIPELDKATAAIQLAKANVDAEQLAIEKAVAAMVAQKKCQKAKAEVSESRSVAVQLETKWIEKAYARSNSLAKRGSVSITKLDEILRELQVFQSKQKLAAEEAFVAQLDLVAVQARIEEIETRSERLAVLEQEIKIAESELEAIRERQNSAIIRASTSGVVTEIFRGAGSSVRVGDPIIQIQGNRIWSEAWIDESLLPEVCLGSPATINLKAFPGVEFRGRVMGVLPEPLTLERAPLLSDNPILQPDSKLCLKIDLEPSSVDLLPGLTGTAVIKKAVPTSLAKSPTNKLVASPSSFKERKPR